MIFKDALRSLKTDFSRTFFYFLTFFLTTFFMFLFFNIAASEQAVTEEYIMDTHQLANIYAFMQNGDIVNLMMGYVLILSCVDIVFANQFFIRNKAEELAVRLVCGATFTQLAFYLLIQTFLLLLIAIPLGILCAIGVIPLLNIFLANVLASPFTIYISSEAITNFVVIICVVVFWTTTLNLSFAYQNEAAAILNGSITTREKSGAIFSSLLGKIPGVLKGIAGIAMIVYMLVSYVTSPYGCAMYGVIAILGLELVLMYGLIPLVTKKIDGNGMKNPLNTIVMSFLREDLRLVRLNIYLFLGNAAVLAGMLVMRIDNELAVLMVMITYIVMNILQAMALMFRLQTHLATRSDEFNVLAQVGYEPLEQGSILVQEMNRFFLMIAGMAVLLILTMILSLIYNGLIPSVYGIIMAAAMGLPLAVIWILSIFYYRRSAHIQDMIHSIEESRQ